MPLNIELLEQVKEQIFSHPEKFRMDRNQGCGCIADFVVAGKPARIPGFWAEVKDKAERELYPDYDFEELHDKIESLFYPKEWDKDLLGDWQHACLASISIEEFQKREAQLAVQMIDRLIAKYPSREV